MKFLADGSDREWKEMQCPACKSRAGLIVHLDEQDVQCLPCGERFYVTCATLLITRAHEEVDE